MKFIVYLLLRKCHPNRRKNFSLLNGSESHFGSTTFLRQTFSLGKVLTFLPGYDLDAATDSNVL